MHDGPRTARISADALTAAIVFRSPKGSRNRHFALHATREAAVARRRAARVHGLLRQITGAFGPAQRVNIEEAGEDEITLRYVLTRVSLTRQARLCTTDLSILRVALARTGARLLPAGLIARDDDRARVEGLLESLVDAPVTEP